MRLTPTIFAFLYTILAVPLHLLAQDDPLVSGREHFDQVVSAAEAFASDVQLIFVESGDVDESGESHRWTYFFGSPGLSHVFAWAYEQDDQSVTRVSPPRPTYPIGLHPDMPPIPDDWIDSGAALKAADENGGNDFRAQHGPDQYHVELFLLPPNDQGRNLLYQDAVWLVTYSGDYGVFQAPIQASTGVFLDFGMPRARTLFDEVESLARLKADDAALLHVRAHEVRPDGSAQVWTYVFGSRSHSSLYQFAVDGGRYGQSGEPIPSDLNPQLSSIPSGWMDSDAALEEAERLGGQEFRESHEDWGINVYLAAYETGWPEWNVFYNAGLESDGFVIDAVPAGTVMARQPIQAVTMRAQQEEADAELVFVGSPSIDLAGRSRDWSYMFKSVSGDTLFMLMTRSGEVLEPIQPIHQDILFNLDLPALPDHFLDSDSAAAIAERIGGADFRASHADANVDVTLLWMEREYTQRLRLGLRPIYLMTYTSPAGDTTLVLDAQAGAYEEWAWRSAADNAPAVESLARSGALPEDAELYRIRAIDADSSGRANYWRFFYMSPSADRRNGIWVLGDYVVPPGTGVEGIQPETVPIPDHWIDSPLAMEAIEDMGGRTFRMDNPGCEIVVELAASPDGAFWHAHYEIGSESRDFQIDALDPTVANEVPGDPYHGPNLASYPNPFSEAVTFEFGLEQRQSVSLLIYDVLGRRRMQVFEGFLGPGVHSIRVDASLLVPGHYFYLLRSGSTLFRGQMLKIR